MANPDPAYRGVYDATYVRPLPQEFPKVVYKPDRNEPKGYRTKIVKSQEEQDALPSGYLTTAADVHAFLSPINAAQYVDPDEVVPEIPTELPQETLPEAASEEKGRKKKG